MAVSARRAGTEPAKRVTTARSSSALRLYLKVAHGMAGITSCNERQRESEYTEQEEVKRYTYTE